MILWNEMVVTKVSAFLYDYEGGGVMFLLILRLVIPGSHGILNPSPSPPPRH